MSAKANATKIKTRPEVDRKAGLLALGDPLPETTFRQMLCRERKRSERSRKPLLLMLVDHGKSGRQYESDAGLERVASVLCAGMRETDLVGWYESGHVLGAIFTELGNSDLNQAAKTIAEKVTAQLQRSFRPVQLSEFQISFYAFPEGWNGDRSRREIEPALYPDLFEAKKARKIRLIVKRAMDIIGSAFALTILSPLFLALAILIKLTSKGSVLFRQERIGQYGAPFQFLKFRSMRASSDTSLHEEYVKNFIAGKEASAQGNGNEEGVYKITNDPRVTWIGRIMRRTSMDELPQFWHVLRGEMSLVGPRPPIAYELEAYDVWHRRRLLEARPGITGLWQVHGRSRMTFDEMVRLDLRYCRTWSPWLDIKILLQTPRAVISGDGAY